MINMQQAILVCTNSIAKRKANRPHKYKLYYSNHPSRVDGSLVSHSYRELQRQFLALGGSYVYAVITPINEPNRFLYFFNREKSKKFTSLVPRTKKSK